MKWIDLPARAACLALALTSYLAAQSTAPALPLTGPEPIRLTLHPARADGPAAHQHLLPEQAVKTPGNAVILYLLARRYWPDQKTTDEVLLPQNRRYSYLDTPIDQFPAADAQRLLAAYAQTLKFVDLGARRRDAVWDTGWRQGVLGDSSQPFAYLDDLRHAENLLSFRARLDISHHDWNAALHTLQTEFSIGRQVQRAPLMIHALVGGQFADVTLSDAVPEWLGRDGSPNLYWPLTDLPHPFVDLRRVVQGEDIGLKCFEPLLWQAIQGQLPAQEWPRVIRKMTELAQKSRHAVQTSPAEIQAQAGKLVRQTDSRARQYLIAQGVPRPQVDAMSAEQAVGTYFCRQYSAAADSFRRAFALPFPQAHRLMTRAWRNLNPDQPPARDNPLIRAILVLTWASGHEMSVDLNLRYQLVRPDREIALMRTIEALRDYAARHQGTPPERLNQITDLPLPLDPQTGEPFPYQLNGRVATLDAPPPPERTRYSGWTYVLTFAQ